MKTYSTSKLLAVFVMVSLLLLPYAFAGKPEKPPNPQEEPVWSVYIPIDDSLGLQGTNQSITDTIDGRASYAFSGADPATRNFANYINHSYSYFNFELLPLSQEYIPVELADTSGWDSCVGDTCEDMLDQFRKEQPNGESFPFPYFFKSQRLYFGFVSPSGYNYETQDEGEFVPLRGYFYIDSAVWGTQEDPQPFDYIINGDFVGESLWVERVNPNTWKIFGHVPVIDATHRDVSPEKVTVCTGKGKNYSCSEVSIIKAISEVQVTFDKYIELYFVREPVE